jgi:hypothetical protein
MAIKINPKNKGKFNALKKRTGKSTEELTHSKNPLTRKRAVFAQNARKWKHAFGGPLVEDPKGRAITNVRNNRFIPDTENNFYNQAIKPFNDTLSLSQFNNLPATIEERSKYLPKDNSWRIEQGKRGSTMNKGYLKYSQNNPIDMGTDITVEGKPIFRNPSAFMIDEEFPGFKKYGGDLYDEYSVGGWLKDNIGNIAKTGAGVGTMFMPGAQGVGAGLIAGGVGDMMSSGQEDEISQIYKPALSKSKQIYDNVVAEGGMNLKRLSQRTDYKGEQHNQGGINLPIGAQVEDGESRTGDIVHSDKIKITKPIMKRYGGKVPLRKGDLGRSVADVVKSRDKRFEKRSGDEWNDQARKISQMPFEEMSNELSQIYDIAQGMQSDISEYPGDMPDKKQGGGKLSKKKANIMLHEGVIRGHPITDKQRRYFGLASKHGTGAGGLDLKKFLGDEGNVPIIGNALMGLTTALTPVEKVRYDQASYTPTAVTPINTEAGISRIKRSFGNSREMLRRLNPRGYMNNLANMGAIEAETIGDYTSNVQGQNAEISNRASMIDSQNRSRIGMFNTQVGMQEAEANAGNRMAKRNAIGQYAANAFTQLGMKSRDDKMMEVQKNYQDQMMELQNRYLDLWSNSKNTNTLSLPVNDNTNPYNDIPTEDRMNYGKGGMNLANKTSILLNKRRYRTY